MQNKRLQLFFVYTVLILASCVTGWLRGRGQESHPVGISTLRGSVQPPLAGLNNAPSNDWSMQWASADNSAKQEVLLSHWLTRDPKALLEFLRRMPPVSVLNQKGWENDALLAWAKREPLAAYRFCCMHNDEFDFADYILIDCLNRDLEQGLALIASPNIRRSWNGMREADFKWIEQNPALVCERLSKIHTGLSSQFSEPALNIWFEQNPEAALRFAKEHGGLTVDLMISSSGFAGAAEQVAKGNKEKDVHELMRQWGEKDVVAATAWAVESLSPASLKVAVDCLRQNILIKPEASATKPRIWTEEQIPALLQNFTPAVWYYLVTDVNKSGINPAFGSSVLGQAPDWIVPAIVSKLELKLEDLESPAKLPKWFTSLTPERAAVVIRLKQAAASKPPSP